MGTLESAERDVALGLTARGFPWQRRRRILRDRGFRRPQDASKPTQHLVHRRRDDCGYADLGCTGQTDYRTPALDRLATEGIRFTQAYANSALCTNTRFALLAGRYQYRLPIGLVEPLRWSDRHAPEMGVPPGFPTLPSLLRGTGYRTAFIGKWHLGYLPRYSPLKSGYDEFFGVMGGFTGYYTHVGDGGEHDLYEGEIPIERAGYVTDILSEGAVAWQRRSGPNHTS